MRRFERIHPIIWALFFSLFGFGLRLHRLEFQPLWGDEGWSFYFATQPPGRLLALTAADIHPPLYYLALKTWLAFGGVEAEMGRFLSIGLGTLLVPTGYALGRRLFEKRVGVMAAAVTAAAPLAIYYSQEVRMYGLATLVGAWSVYCFVRWQSARLRFPGPQRDGGNVPVAGRRWSIAYALTTTAALYTHYYTALLLLFQIGLVLFRLVRKKSSVSSQRRGSALRPFLLIGLLYLPWALYIGWRLPGYVAAKRALDADLPLNVVRFFGDHFVAFSVGHLSPALRQYVWGALPFIGAASLGFIAALFYFNKRKSALYLFLYLFTPLLSGYLINQIFPFNPPYFERTLLLAAPAYWLLIAAGLIWLWDRRYLLVGTIVLAMLLATGVVLTDFYATPRYPHEDYRPFLKKIAAQATPEDTLLASYQWQLGFYQAYLPPPRPRLFTVPGWGEGWAGPAGQARLRRDVNRIFETSPRLWFPAYQLLGRLWEDRAELVINRLGYPTLLEWYGPQTKLTLTRAPSEALEPGPTANFAGRLRLLESRIGRESYEAGRGIVPVALTWRKVKSLGSEQRVTLRLVDADGRAWAVRDAHPQGGRAFFTDLMVGEQLADRHGLLIPAGTPPGEYRLLLSVRRVNDAHPLDLIDEAGQPAGAELALGQVTVIDPIRPVGPAALPVQTAAGAVFGDRVRLVGYSLGQEPFKAGQPLPLTLFWQSVTAQPTALTVLVELRDAADQTVVFHHRRPVRPASTWGPDILVRDPHEFLLPPALPPGAYQIRAALATPEQALLPVGGEEWLRLAVVTVVDRPHVFEPPDPQIDMAVSFGDQARLVGLDLPQMRVQGGQELPVTLYWQGLKTFDTGWTVFIHLVDEQGQIVAQQDQVPGGGQFPTTSWLPNEYVTDSYNLSIPADVAPGEKAYQLRIGLYNAAGRLPVTEAGQIVGDYVALENWQISVE